MFIGCRAIYIHLVIFVKSIFDFYAKCNQIASHALYNKQEFQETFFTNSTLNSSKKQPVSKKKRQNIENSNNTRFVTNI